MIETYEFLFRPHALVRETEHRVGDSQDARTLRDDATKILTGSALLALVAAGNVALLTFPDGDNSVLLKGAAVVVGVVSAVTSGVFYKTAAQNVAIAHSLEPIDTIDCRVLIAEDNFGPSTTPPSQG